ncbi:hypothetical protein Goe21_02540 [Bacillus phage vB_BsuM-Goe21]|nr:hypothetical protein Goe21_02540 [Bacillus phage vB_BsuM-Goe21]
MFRGNVFLTDILYVKHTGYEEKIEYHFKENESIFDFARILPMTVIVERATNVLIRHEVKDGFIYIPSVIKEQNNIFDLSKYELFNIPLNDKKLDIEIPSYTMIDSSRVKKNGIKLIEKVTKQIFSNRNNYISNEELKVILDGIKQEEFNRICNFSNEESRYELIFGSLKSTTGKDEYINMKSSFGNFIFPSIDKETINIIKKEFSNKILIIDSERINKVINNIIDFKLLINLKKQINSSL